MAKKQEKPHLRLPARLQKLSQAAASTCYMMILLTQPAAAAAAGDTIWSRFSSIMADVYGQLVGISTIVAVTAASVALLVRMISRNERAVSEATSWLKRIIVTWIVLNTLGFAVAYLQPLIEGGQYEVKTMYDDQQCFGDGQDNYLHGAQKAVEAAKTANIAAGGTAAHTAAAGVKAGVEGSKAAAEISTGAAAGGPLGAALSAAWSLRNTLFKILVFLCLFQLFIVVTVVSLPSVVINNIFHLDPDTVDLTGPTELTANFDDLSATVSACIQSGYDAALERVEEIISSGGYDHDLSMDALINNGLISTDYDTCYTLAAYSASMEQRGVSKVDFQTKLQAVKNQMYRVTYEAKETEIATTNDDGESETTTVQYVVCTIHPFDQSVILTAFEVNTDAQYSQFNITYGEAITHMSNALKMTLYGTLTSGMVPEITDLELNAYLASLECSGARKELMRAALSLVGRVPYFWGGKSAPGWNEAWNTPRLVTAAGSSSSGTIRPYGLDCSGFTEWVYQTALGASLNNGSWSQ